MHTLTHTQSHAHTHTGSLPIRVSPSKTPVRSETSHKDRRGNTQGQQQQQRIHHQNSSGDVSLHEDDAMYAAEQVRRVHFAVCNVCARVCS